MQHMQLHWRLVGWRYFGLAVVGFEFGINCFTQIERVVCVWCPQCVFVRESEFLRLGQAMYWFGLEKWRFKWQFLVISWRNNQIKYELNFRLIYFNFYIIPFSRVHFSAIRLIKKPRFLKNWCLSGIAWVPGPLVLAYTLHSCSVSW